MRKQYDVAIRIITVAVTFVLDFGAFSAYDAFYTVNNHLIHALVTTIIIWELHRLCFLKAYKVLLPDASMGKRIAVLFIISYVLTFTIRFYNFYSEAWLYHLPYPEPKAFLKGNFFICFLAVWPFIATYEILYVNRLTLQIEQEKEDLAQANLQRQYESLREQVNPHFLFNNLNSLSTLITKDPEKADQFIEEMSSVYRYLLRNNTDNVTSLNEELEFIESYNHLLQTRFADGYEPSIEIEDKMKQYKIPPMTLQLLVENALKHNIVSAEEPLRLNIYTKNERLIVTNNVQPKAKAVLSTGVGLDNIISKYKLLKQPPVEIKKTRNQFTVVLPLIK